MFVCDKTSLPQVWLQKHPCMWQQQSTVILIFQHLKNGSNPYFSLMSVHIWNGHNKVVDAHDINNWLRLCPTLKETVRICILLWPKNRNVCHYHMVCLLKHKPAECMTNYFISCLNVSIYMIGIYLHCNIWCCYTKHIYIKL